MGSMNPLAQTNLLDISIHHSTSLMNGDKSFNVVYNTSNGYDTSCIDRWRPIKAYITEPEVCGNDIFVPRFENVVPFNLQVQMEPNALQDSAMLALQIQTLIANVEELTRQNQEMRLQLQQEETAFINIK
uniref:Uncharacterized protein n=1 Tax=Quercus lobata TaxID=97700 RepID=A0A7N2KXM2_QUELO